MHVADVVSVLHSSEIGVPAAGAAPTVMRSQSNASTGMHRVAADACSAYASWWQNHGWRRCSVGAAADGHLRVLGDLPAKCLQIRSHAA